MERLRKFISLLLVWALLAGQASAASAWNGAAFTALNGVVQTAWNGTAITCASIPAPTTIPANVFVNMNTADGNGTALTTAIMGAGTQGTIGTAAGDWSFPLTNTNSGLTIESSGSDLLDDVTLYQTGTNYLANSTHRRFACEHTTGQKAAQLSLPNNYRACSVGCWITLGPTDQGGSAGLYDYLSIFKGSGFAVFQLNNGLGGGGTGYAVNVETNSSGTVHSTYQTVTPAARYWVTLYADFVAGTCGLQIFDTTGAQVGSTITSTVLTTPTVNDVLFVQIGTRQTKTEAGRTTYFEGLLVDYMTAAPIAPTGASGYWKFKYASAFNDASGGNSGNGELTCTLAGVAAGDVVFTGDQWEGATTTSVITDGTSTLTGSPVGVQNNVGSNGEPHLSVNYILSSVASGSVTYKQTLGAARAWRQIQVLACTPPSGYSTVTLDGTATSNSATSGTSITSGNITTTGARNLAVCLAATYGQSFHDFKTNGVRGISTVSTLTGQTGKSVLWAVPSTSGYTAGGATTGGASNRWCSQIIAVKAN